ncbi:cytochrome P450 [Lentzea sp. HUAS12]|uniref:cytochrome P450 n=1 Tax=Lentzea sp. HUAS12 TaxID=2951806 RepID=UPI00209E6809|nr:cytochrome P450 [Lentzea sp. HUAS12]USX51568.1 cytochrome P450 [Lentzea sp. HUAS12]
MHSSTAERHARFRLLRERSPVHFDADIGGWCITRYDDVLRVLDLDSGAPQPLPKRAITHALKLTRPVITLATLELLDADDVTFAHSLAATAAEAFTLAHGVEAFAATALETTRAFLTNALAALQEHPDQATLLRTDPSTTRDAVEELLRFDTPIPVAPARRTPVPVVLSGRTVEAGEVLVPLVAAANRCSVRFPGGDRLDLRRKPVGVLSACPTSTALARVTGEIALVRRLRAVAR